MSELGITKLCDFVYIYVVHHVDKDEGFRLSKM